MIAVTIVSIGIAQAEILVATRRGDGSLAVIFVALLIIVGTIVGTMLIPSGRNAGIDLCRACCPAAEPVRHSICYVLRMTPIRCRAA